MPSALTIYSTPWCGYCVRLKRQLDRAGVDYDEVNIEADPDAARFVMQCNDGMATVPTVRFPDGTTLTNPTVHAVTERLRQSA